MRAIGARRLRAELARSTGGAGIAPPSVTSSAFDVTLCPLDKGRACSDALKPVWLNKLVCDGHRERPRRTRRRVSRIGRAGRIRPPAVSAPITVLVTGAAGLIGSELCGALAERGHRVVAMIHRRAHLVRSDGSRVPDRVALLRGDITQRDLGLGTEVAAILARCDRVVHCAADTSLAPGRHGEINVGGTQNLLDVLASMRAAPGLVHVSTAYVCGARSGPVAETMAEHDGTNPYEASKIESERRVAAAGLGAAIARPSIVVGRWHDGAISRFDDLYGLIRLVAAGRIRALPVAPGATLDFVPIDHVVGGLLDLVERFEMAGNRVFHLASGAPMPVRTLCTTAFAGFHAPRLIEPDDAEASGRGTLRRELLSLYAGYLTRDPRFATGNLAALSGRVAPPVDVAFLRRMIGYAHLAGYLRRDPQLASAGEHLT